MSRAMHAPMLGEGIYTLPDAARLAGLPLGKLRKWVQGYEYRDGVGEKRSAGPVVPRRMEALEGRIAITFKDLVEVYWVKTFLDHGISMHAIRRASAEAEELLHDDHPFCLVQFAHAGRDIFAKVIDDKEQERIVHLGRRQFVFSEVIKPLLLELEYAESKKAGVVRWWPLGTGRRVVLDPGRSFGRPIDGETGVPTDVLYAGWLAERDIDRVARWYQVPRLAVDDAIAFEERHRSAA